MGPHLSFQNVPNRLSDSGYNVNRKRRTPRKCTRARAADDSIGGPQMLKFLNALAALATVGTFVIAFLDSYEVRFKVRRRTRGADGGRHLRRNKRK